MIITMVKLLPPKDELDMRWDYDPSTGIFVKKKTGKRVGFYHRQGYIMLKIGDRMLRAHRVAYKMMTGEEPPEVIDHINGKRDDNRWCNLRACSVSDNQRNAHRSKSNGLPRGVQLVRLKDGSVKYKVMLAVGTYDTLDEAVDQYSRARQLVLENDPLVERYYQLEMLL